MTGRHGLWLVEETEGTLEEATVAPPMEDPSPPTTKTSTRFSPPQTSKETQGSVEEGCQEVEETREEAQAQKETGTQTVAARLYQKMFYNRLHASDILWRERVLQGLCLPLGRYTVQGPLRRGHDSD